ncbi:MAG: DUF927 domain-containing protein [Phascolarctobacterium sp.]|uniref:DUF927 domain-containing protein n=1 Tax=Phascolarctobacterium sp. TaxID=2049039 RepID=UPI0026DDC0AB|nr:DUF927 domain-containing protein [Phascolarctobacterium sp.]MDO4920949.1 DUF927 domain-containing protein [Phascolarctobacterium sp.]
MISRSDGGRLTLDDIRPYLVNPKQKGGQIVADCPLCHKQGHLYISVKNDKLLVYCQRCNAQGADFFREWRRLGAKPRPPEPKPKIDYARTKPMEDYYHIYTNPDGSEAYRKRRRKWADGHKVFGFEFMDGTGNKRYSKPENCNNLYNLHLLEQAAPDTVLYLVEGEKCADAMVKHGLLATTTNTGAQKNIKLSAVDRQYLDKFTAKVVIGDNDAKGKDYINAWRDVKVLKLTDIWPECPEKGDVADYFEQGGDPEKISSYKWPEEIKLDDEFIGQLDRNSLIDDKLLDAVYAINEPYARQKILTSLRIRAGALNFRRDFDSCWRSFAQAQTAKGIRSENMTNFKGQPFKLRCGEWRTGQNGVYRTVQQGDNLRNEYASPTPIMPTEILQNMEDGTEKIRIAYERNGAWESIVIPRSKIANKNRILDLADYGIEVNSENAAQLVKYIATAVALNPDILPRSKSIDHMGWVGSRFVPYDDEISLDCEQEYKPLIRSVTEKGTLTEWVEYVSPLRKNKYMQFILAASFASVLIERVKALPFVLHLWGGTGSGKTVAAMTAASIWGNPAQGKLMRTMNTTANAMMSTAAVLRNIPFFGDELQTIKTNIGNEYDKLIMRIAEGIDRGRMNSGKEIQKQRSWYNNFIFTGEEPCTSTESGGGVINRVIEIECFEKIVADGNAVVNFIGSHYGCAGKAFVEALANEALATDYQNIMRQVLEQTDTTEKQAMAMALIIMADIIAARYIFKDGLWLSIEDAVKVVKSKAEVDVSERAFSYIVSVISENQEFFDTEIRDWEGRAYWGRINTDDGIVYINKSILERELRKKNFEFNAVKKKWVDNGHLKKVNGRYYAAYTFSKVRSYYVALVVSPKSS